MLARDRKTVLLSDALLSCFRKPKRPNRCPFRLPLQPLASAEGGPSDGWTRTPVRPESPGDPQFPELQAGVEDALDRTDVSPVYNATNVSRF